MRRTLFAGIPILVLWASAIAWLGARQGWWLEQVSAGGPAILAPIESRLRVLVGEAPVGEVTLLRTVTDTTVSTDIEAHLDLPLFGVSTPLDLEASMTQPSFADPTAGAEGATVRLTVRSGEQEMTLDAALVDGALCGTVETAGETLPLDVPVDEQLMLAGMWAPLANVPPLRAGERVALEGFDPLTLRAAPMILRGVGFERRTIDGETMDTRVVDIEGRGIGARVWLDDRGTLVRAETPIGLVLELASPQTAPAASESADRDAARSVSTEASPGIAREALDGAEALARALAVFPTGQRPQRGAHRMVVTVGDGLPVIADQRQRQDQAGNWQLGAIADDPAAQHPQAGHPKASHPQPEHLAADAFIQSDHPRIRAQAETVLTDASTPTAQILALHDWVYEHLEKVPVASLPSALAVLDAQRGDCNEHTVLFAALARAAGLPTRIAVGLVWSEELEAFGYHAWPEVWTGDHWWATDPTLGQLQADATHIKLIEGSVLAWRELMTYLGRIRIDVLDVRMEQE